MSDEKKNGHRITPQTVIAFVAVVASIGGSWFAWGQHTGELNQRVTTVEKRQDEDRQNVYREQKQITEKVERVDGNVQLILRKLDAMEAVQRAERERR